MIGFSMPIGQAVGLEQLLSRLGVADLASRLSEPGGPTATVLAAIMGFQHQPLLPLILTLLVATLLGLAGAWIGSAARGLVALSARVDANGNG